MTTTRAPLPALISSHCNKSRKRPQHIATRSKSWQTAANDTNDRTCKFRHACGILNVPYARKETNRDHDGRISHRRRGRQNAQDIRGFCDEALTTRETARIQDRRVVACGSEGTTGVSGKEEEHSRQEINVNIDQYYQVVKQPSLSYQPSESCHSSRYPLISILPYYVWQGQAFFVPKTHQQQRIDIRWVDREDTLMVIGISPTQLYPLVTNSPYAIFGVRGSKVVE